jgi:hypothetical protein
MCVYLCIAERAWWAERPKQPCRHTRKDQCVAGVLLRQTGVCLCVFVHGIAERAWWAERPKRPCQHTRKDQGGQQQPREPEAGVREVPGEGGGGGAKGYGVCVGGLRGE